MSRDELRETFYLECEDLLEVLGSGLIMMDDGTNDDETINAIFRAVHSIKGGAAAFGLNELVDFAHTFETALDEVRSGRLELVREVLSVFLRGSDNLSDLVSAARDGTPVDEAALNHVLEEIRKYIPEGGDETANDADF